MAHAEKQTVNVHKQPTAWLGQAWWEGAAIGNGG